MTTTKPDTLIRYVDKGFGKVTSKPGIYLPVITRAHIHATEGHGLYVEVTEIPTFGGALISTIGERLKNATGETFDGDSYGIEIHRYYTGTFYPHELEQLREMLDVFKSKGMLIENMHVLEETEALVKSTPMQNLALDRLEALEAAYDTLYGDDDVLQADSATPEPEPVTEATTP